MVLSTHPKRINLHSIWIIILGRIQKRNDTESTCHCPHKTALCKLNLRPLPSNYPHHEHPMEKKQGESEYLAGTFSKSFSWRSQGNTISNLQQSLTFSKFYNSFLYYSANICQQPWKVILGLWRSRIYHDLSNLIINYLSIALAA